MKKLILGWRASRPPEILTDFLAKIVQFKASEGIYFPVPYGKIKDLSISHPTLKFGAKHMLPTLEESFTKSIALELLKTNNTSFVLVVPDETNGSHWVDQIPLLRSCNIVPIVCCGDPASRENNSHALEQLKEQLLVLKKLSDDDLDFISLIYAPKWINHSLFIPNLTEVHDSFNQFLSIIDELLPGKIKKQASFCLLPNQIHSLEDALKLNDIEGFFIEDGYPFLDEILSYASTGIHVGSQESQEVADIVQQALLAAAEELDSKPTQEIILPEELH